MEAMRTEVTRARRSAKDIARKLREEGQGFNREDLWGDGSSRGADGREEQTVHIPKWKEFHLQFLAEQGKEAAIEAANRERGKAATVDRYHRAPSPGRSARRGSQEGEPGRVSPGSSPPHESPTAEIQRDESFDDTRIMAQAQAQIEKWRAEFEDCDIDNSGYLDNDELVEVTPNSNGNAARRHGHCLIPVVLLCGRL